MINRFNAHLNIISICLDMMNAPGIFTIAAQALLSAKTAIVTAEFRYCIYFQVTVIVLLSHTRKTFQSWPFSS